jgi:hypothetical protein
MTRSDVRERYAARTATTRAASSFAPTTRQADGHAAEGNMSKRLQRCARSRRDQPLRFHIDRRYRQIDQRSLARRFEARQKSVRSSEDTWALSSNPLTSQTKSQLGLVCPATKTVSQPIQFQLVATRCDRTTLGAKPVRGHYNLGRCPARSSGSRSTRPMCARCCAAWLARIG